MAHGDQRSKDGPTFRTGFTGFVVRDRSVNLTGSVLGLVVWLVTYWLGGRIIVGPADAVVARAAVVAAAVTSAYSVPHKASLAN